MTMAECHPERRNAGRGLCSTCYSRAWRTGTLDQHEIANPARRRSGRPVTCLSIAEDALWVLECGCRCHQEGPITVHGRGRGCPCGGQRAMAERLGITTKTLAQALKRARARGVMVA